MILIPIGHEEQGVRRLPWVTFGLMAACLLALIASGGATRDSSHDEAIERDITAAMEYYVAHPYLALDPELAELMQLDEQGVHGENLMTVMSEAAVLPDQETRRLEQAQLDDLAAAAMESVEAHPYMSFGLRPSEFSVPALLTHMFMHAGWLHLLGNLLILYLAGPYIEDVWGRPLYLSFYLLSGVAAALAFVAMHKASNMPLVGASGAIAGVMGAFLVRYWSTRIRFFYMVGLLVRGTFSAPAWLMLPLWFVQQLFMASLTEAGGGSAGVAYSAHIGGFVLGIAVAWGIRAKGIEERYLNPAIEQNAHETVIDNTAVEIALDAHGAGNHEQALEELSALADKDPSNSDAVLALWSICLDLGCPQRGETAMKRLIQRELRQTDRSPAIDHWRELTKYLPATRLDATEYVRLAQALIGQQARDEAAVLLRRAMLEGGTRLSPAVALQIARVGQTVDTKIAMGAARTALARPDLDPDSRQQLETVLAKLSPAPLSRA